MTTNERALRIVIADDHTVLREGLSGLLSAVDGWEVIAQANDGFEVLPLIENHQPDLLILDLTMPNLGGVETIARVQKLKNRPVVLVLSARDDDNAVRDAIDAGAKGYVTKNAGSDELLFAIRALMKGQTYITPSVAGSVFNRPSDDSDGDCSPLSSLSTREREVMKLLAEGKPNRDVAKLLHISPRTVDSHRANILKKLDKNSNAELVLCAIRYGLVE